MESVHSESYMVAGIKPGGQQIMLLRLRQRSESGANEVTYTYHIDRHGEDCKELIYAIGVARCETVEANYGRGAERRILPGIHQ